MNSNIQTVSMEGTEQEFITAFVSAITSTDSRIACETNIAEQFADGENIPTFVFNINSCYKIKMERRAKAAAGESNYIFTVIINNAEKIKTTIGFNSLSGAYDKEIQRTYNFVIFGTDEFLVIKFFPYNVTNAANPSLFGISIHENGFNAVTGENITSTKAISSINFLRTDSTGQGEVYKFATRLPYAMSDGQIEIIKNKALLSGSFGSRVFSDMYDCSVIVKDSVITIDGNNYYALDENTLALI